MYAAPNRAFSRRPADVWVAAFVGASLACACGGDSSGNTPTDGSSPSEASTPPVAEAGSDGSTAPPADGASASDSASSGSSDGSSSGEASSGSAGDGASTGDGSSGAPADASSGADGSTDGATVSCVSPPADLSACSTTNDCSFVARGCYCGQQLVYGVATKYRAGQAACEQANQSHCALGCANSPGQVAQDGRSTLDGGTMSVRCASVDGGSLECQTFVQ